jgi:hypothetical protein
MRRVVISLLPIILFITALSAHNKNDVIIMKNGDRITCEIVSLSDRVLYVKLDYADGTISLQWSKVARLESKRSFRVKTAKGQVYTGTLATVDPAADQPVTIEVVKEPDNKVELSSVDVVTIGTMADEFLKRFNGEISFGASYTKGNRSAQYNLNSSLEYPRERWRALATLNSSFSSTSGVGSSTRNELSLRFDRLLPWNNYFYTGSVRVLQSSEQGIHLQANISGGVGYYFKNTGRLKASVVGGLTWQRIDYSGSGSGRATQHQVGGVVITDIRYFRFKKTTFDLEAAFVPSITEPGRAYFALRQSYYIKLFSNLSWNISFYGNWDSRPPAGLSGSDYGTSTGLAWTFGNR